MKFRNARVACIFFLTSIIAGAVEYPAAPEKSYFSAGLWRNRDLVKVPVNGLWLFSDTIIKADELILDGPLYTNGHVLKIDVLQITFHDGGKIVGFLFPAKQLDDAPEGAAGISGDQVKSPAQMSEMTGKTPDKPKMASAGEQHPGAIVIYAERVLGIPVIDGTGQKGAKGTHGGKGGRGGTGRHGTDGQANCWPNPSWNGGRGWPGGKGGPGGDGGDGGQGGRPIPIVFVTGENAPSTGTFISKPGDGGDPGDPGEPGDQGPGGKGGSGDSTGCYYGKKGVDAGPDGQPGPVQTLKGQVGTKGVDGPALDPVTEPLPQLQSLADMENQGIVRSALSELESARLQLVDAWSQFHWARTFLFLTMDSLTELKGEQNQNIPSAGELLNGSDDVLLTLLQQTNQERLQKLIQLWQDNSPPAADSKDSTPLRDATFAAKKVIALLQQVNTDPSANQILRAMLADLRGALSTQFRGTLNDALESCRQYNNLKDKEKAAVLNLTSQYSVPVCDGSPDFRKPENIDKAIALFQRLPPLIPDPFTLIREARLELHPLNELLPQAFAEGIVVVPVDHQTHSEKEIQERLPPRDRWMVEGLGVFTGFPQVTQSGSIADIGERLFYLKQNLVRIRAR